VSVIWTGLWGVLLVIVMAGIFTSWVTARGATWGLLFGGLVNLYTPWALYYNTPQAERISFIWVGVPGWLVALVVVVLISVFDPRKTAELTGLTWRTTRVPVAER
jgi:Na+/proline symporter